MKFADQSGWGPIIAAAIVAAAFVGFACGESDSQGLAAMTAPASSAGTADHAATATPSLAGTPFLSPMQDHSEDGPFGRALSHGLPGIDLTNRRVSLAEIVAGGVGADDGIPSLREPKFETVAESTDWMVPFEPVITLVVNNEPRIYPIQILIWHEVVNDELGGEPVLVTFCPLCYTAIAFDRRVDGEVREFGVSGFLRESDLLLFDDQTITLWQQLTGEGIVGTDAGKRLRFLPAQIVSFLDAHQQYPDALVLSRDTGFSRAYGRNPYGGYDDINTSPIFGTSFDDHRLPAVARILAVEYGGEAVAFPFDALSERVVIDATVGGASIVAFWQPGTLSALNRGSIASSQDVGAAGAFIAELEGVPIAFESRDGAIYDTETDSRWNVLGAAVEGPLEGERLEPVVSGSHFWFIWSIFLPDTRVITE